MDDFLNAKFLWVGETKGNFQAGKASVFLSFCYHHHSSVQHGQCAVLL